MRSCAGVLALAAAALVGPALAGRAKRRQRPRHAGRPPDYVTRLKHYDGSGPAALLEAEARWQRSEPSAARGRPPIYVTRLQRYDGSGPAALVEAEARWQRLEPSAARGGTPASGRRATFSERQVRALLDHHAQQQAVVQLSQTVEGSHPDVTSPTAGRAIKVHPSPRQHSSSFYVQKLKNLGSEYVGAIGVGTTSTCEPATDGAPSALASVRQHANGSDAEATCSESAQATMFTVLDTGSTNIWINSDECTEGPCAKADRSQFSARKSLSYKDFRGKRFLNIKFGTGEISGWQAMDNIRIAGRLVKNQIFGLVQKEVGELFEQMPLDGIVGLAFPSMSANGATPLFDNIIEQKALDQNVFSFYFSLNDDAANAVFWGGVDHRFFEGEREWFQVTEAHYWELDLFLVLIGDEPILREADVAPEVGHRIPKAIIDTGTTFFTAQGEVWKVVAARLKRTRCDSMTSASHPDLTFRLRNMQGKDHDFVFTAEQYMVDDGNGTCNMGFMHISIPEEHGPAMIFGELFLRYVFTTFDRGDGAPENARVGFATAKQGSEVVQALQELTRGPEATGARAGSRPDVAHAAEKTAERTAERTVEAASPAAWVASDEAGA